ncbi:hypothetical protein RhiirA4_473941 [Rhizophagus irregularis]|uniref:Uncharacterized protein n=1 Tax=Rhizophagus irregularis TaxID=588596 RepID=A0A2I1H7N9_9GLOM|nr:hypothetical protein RhiirA4_473941 [Rhizophagus irregularis]
MSVNIIIDEQFNKVVPKPINNRPGYDMKYIVNCYYGTDINKIIEVEKEYDTLSVIKPGQSLIAWAVKAQIRLQELLSNQRFSIYHRYYLFAGFGNEPKKTYFDRWHRYGYEVKSEDLMQNHWDHSCSKARTRNGSARLIQNAYQNYKKRPR